MDNFILSGESTCDLDKEYFNKRNIRYVCFHFFINGVEYEDDLGESIPFSKFYQMMRDGDETKTSQVNVEDYVKYFESFLSQGKDIIHLCLSSGISGTVNSAMIAKSMLEEKYPNRKIYVVDSLGASSGFGLLMDKLADLRDLGWNIDQIKLYAEEHRLNLHHWFFSTDLTFYVRGGRVSKVSGFVGTVLKICPLLNMDNLGRLIPREKIRSKQKVINTIVQRMVENAEGGLDYNGKCFISNSDCLEDAQHVAALVEATFPKLNGKVHIFNIGTTIGSHTGPGTVALFFFGKKREN